MARTHVGRHRAPGFSPLNEIADIASKTASPAVKVSAVAVASGGLVASFALPASAAPSEEGSSVAAGAVSTAPQIASQTVAVAAPAVDNAVAPTFGVVGFTAKAATQQAPASVEITKIEIPAPAAPAAAPAVAATTTRASRTTTRTTTAATPTVTAAPKAAPAPAAPAAPAPTGGIIGIAAGLTGIPYVWGGTTTGGFDCSGYTGYVYARAGISIPRTAEAQRAASTKVSNPVPGDLIFFGFPAYHVGIYAGGGKLYEASRPGTSTGLHTIWSTNVSYGRF
ncbi:MAG: C40 family peptidase [Lapillicoccus sp.]